jgi:hypothetical protein
MKKLLLLATIATIAGLYFYPEETKAFLKKGGTAVVNKVKTTDKTPLKEAAVKVKNNAVEVVAEVAKETAE